MEFLNPFRTPVPQPNKRQVFSSRMESARTPADVAVQRAAQERQRHELTKGGKEFEHLHSVLDLHRYLEESGHGEACKNLYSCDPWKYEPILLEELEKHRGSPRLRGLIRAGSWMTYPRMDLDAVLDRLHTVRRLDTNPADAQALDAIESALKTGKLGADLEPETQALEHISRELWLQLKRALAPHGIPSTEASNDQTTKPLRRELDALRPIRDFLYYRTLYPTWAKLGLETR